MGRETRKNRGLTATATMIAIMGLLAGLITPTTAAAQTTGQQTFKTAQAAAQALFEAAKNRDKAMALKVLGADSESLFNTGDESVDVSQHQLFVNKYQQMHRLVSIGGHTDILYVGAENWPLPIPIKQGKAGWYFDTVGSRAEIMARRIGANELSAINVCLAIVQAQNEYKSQLHDSDKVNQYAQRLASTDSKHDGLYWKTGGAEPKSPLGPRLAMASYQGGAEVSAKTTPYHGYFFKALSRQGKDAPGGAKDYLDNGKLTGGFAVIAYPARYRVSGVTTFIVNQDGIVYQKDLGPDTDKVASSITEYNPDKSWIPAN